MSGWLHAARTNDLSTTQAWLNLLHYQKTFSGFVSEADGPGFFLSPEGKNNPHKELLATIDALNDINKKYGKLQVPAACVFTARKKLLEKNDYTFPEVSCPDYEGWRKGLPIKSISLVFATAYPNNPASMFGHTFLRLNGPGEGKDLLDYAVNFAATTGEAGGIEFALFGVFGGYEGHYSLAPYFIKVNEYNHGEARDLWEYPVKVSPEAIDMLLAHLWEIESSSFFDYYFFDENCSWQILRLLEAADPSLHLTSSSDFYVIPGETVKWLSKKKLLGEPIFRSSLRRQYRARGEPHSEKEKLEKKLQYFRLKERLGKNSGTAQKEYHRILTERSKDPSPVVGPAVPIAGNRPDQGHGLSRISFTQGDGFRRLGFRFAQHDLLDQDQGHEPWSALDVMRFSAEENSGKISIREASLVDVVSLHAWDGLDFEPSWYLHVGAESPREFECIKCFTGVLRVGLGQTFRSSEDGFITALFLGGRSYGKGDGHTGMNGGVGFRSLTGITNKKFKLLLDVERIWGIKNDRSYLADLSLAVPLNSSWSLRGNMANLYHHISEAGLSILYYY